MPMRTDTVKTEREPSRSTTLARSPTRPRLHPPPTTGALIRSLTKSPPPQSTPQSSMSAVARAKSHAMPWVSLAKARVRRRHELIRQQHASRLVLEVGTASDLSRTSYQQQGDASLNSEFAFAVRANVRRHPAVTRALDNWWRAAIGTARFWRPHAQSLLMHDYILVYVTLHNLEPQPPPPPRLSLSHVPPSPYNTALPLILS